MKNFPTLKDAEIKFSLTQPEAKLLLIVVSSFIDTNRSIEEKDPGHIASLIKVLQKEAMQNYRFSMPFGILDEPENLLTHVETTLIDKLQQPYFDVQSDLQFLFRDEVNKLAKEIDPEIFDLQEGEHIELAVDNQLYTASSKQLQESA